MKRLKGINLIILDWNGTLLNDVEVCVDAMNSLLSVRNLPPIDTFGYKDIFTFPVKDYYTKAGFNFNTEPFEVPAMQFMDLYRSLLPKANLHASAIGVLTQLNMLGMTQAVLSAMEQKLLESLLCRYQLTGFFDHTFGIDNHYEAGKTDRGKALILYGHYDPKTCLLIGDTLHDAEVAYELGCKCLLFDGGLQSRKTLETSGCEIISDLEDIFLLE